MLRIIHTADVHLGARHDDLGEQAAAQRERQFAAFKATVDLALTEKADVFLIAGDLFDSNVQPRRSVERVAAELKRLAEARIRTVIIPGTHDCYDRASIYRAYDLVALAGRRADDGSITILETATGLERSRLIGSKVSATSMAYSSLRMEPTFMVIGQAAGEAAAMAIEAGVSVHDVDVKRLQARLRVDGQVLD
jgi:DNA repair exonuclease SbcCD nuclease subunit